MRIVLTFALVALAGTAAAHDAPSGWRYDPLCCNGDSHQGDCQAIAASTVKAVEGGYVVTLAPGDHRLATRRHVFFLSKWLTRRSQDGEYHLCLFPNEDTPWCFYAPDMGF